MPRIKFKPALDAFEEALAERRTGTDEQAIEVARWMVAWALRNLGRTGEGQVPVSPWNTMTKGYRTRNNKRTQTMIVSRRKK